MTQTSMQVPDIGLSANNNNMKEEEENNHPEINKFAENSKEIIPGGTRNRRFGERNTWVTCDVCKVELSSSKLMEAHSSGKRHVMNLRKALRDTGKQIFYCEICKVTTNGEKQLQIHLAGRKHLGVVEARDNLELLKYISLYGSVVVSALFVFVSSIFFVIFKYWD